MARPVDLDPAIDFPAPRGITLITPGNLDQFVVESKSPGYQTFRPKEPPANTLVAAFHLVDPSSGTDRWMDVGSYEYIAGMLAISHGLLFDLNRPDDATVQISGVTPDVNFTGRVVIGAPSSERDNYRPPVGQYAVWIRAASDYEYDMYLFHSAIFLQGVLSLCEAFGTDFRNYILGFPFDSDGITHTFRGYAWAHSQVAVDVEDLDDQYAEDVDDENVIEPLKKDY